jgi:hypothetical protein
MYKTDMKTALIFALVLGSLGGQLAPAFAAAGLEIEPSVQITFETETNKFYQVETASSVDPDRWTPVGPTHWGYGKPLTQTVVTSPASQSFFRAREYDLTNALLAYFPLDGGVSRDEKGFGQEVSVIYFMPSRFGSHNHAGRNRGDSLDPYGVSMSVQRFAQGTDDFTVSVWIMGSFDVASPTNFGNVFSMDKLAIVSTNGTIQMFLTAIAAPILTSPIVTWENERWYNIQVVRAKNIYTIYRDLVVMGQAAAPKTVAPFRDYFTVVPGPARGGVDEARFYNRALSVEELTALYRLAEL